MKRRGQARETGPRQLVFEQLEQKHSPTSLLLVIAPLPEADQEQLEQWLASQQTQPAAESAWQLQHDSVQLLQFVEEQTRASVSRDREHPPPTAAECEAADRWLRLERADLRTIVICAAIYPEHRADEPA